MDFQTDLIRIAAETETALNDILVSAKSSRLGEAMRYATLGGGKRLRPLLVAQSAALFQIPQAQSVRVGAALELIHCYSLVHDDLPAMDDDDLRRGRPTVHKKYDEATAILAGDALLTLAFEVLADAATHPDAQIRSALILAMAQAAGRNGMVAGQMLDLEAETAASPAQFEQILYIQQLKTGALFRFACESGALMAGEDPRFLREFADHLGLAFQITDDLLDVESTAQTLGKATQKDHARGKATFVDLLGLEAARTEAEKRIYLAQQALAGYGQKAQALCATAAFVLARSN